MTRKSDHPAQLEMFIDLENLQDIPVEKIPAVLSQLASQQGKLAAAAGILSARLLENRNHRNGAHAGEKGKLLDVKETAARLGKSPDWIYRNKEKLKSFLVPVGGSLKFVEAGLEKWVTNHSGR